MAGNALLELRRDTAANWTSANPTLASGEPGLETDTGKLKLGDGSTAWTSLAYFAVTGPSSAVDGHVALFSATTGKLLKDGGVGNFANGAIITPTATPATNEIGYLGSPVLAGLDSGNVAPALTDCGKTFYHTDANARNFTIPANGSVAFPVGTILAVENGPSGGVVSIIITTDVLYWGSSTGTRSVAANGGCTIQKLDSTHWRLRGDGIT